MRSFATDKRRVDRFEPEIKRILGEQLIATADIERDQKQATDMLVLSMKPFTVGCRVRGFDCLTGYDRMHGEPWIEQFTIRASRPSGVETELSKMTKGWGDYGFYGFADAGDAELAAWTIYRYDVFRHAFTWSADVRRRLKEQMSNTDRSSTFACFSWGQFPPEMVVAQGGDAFVEKWTNDEYQRLA